MGGLFLSKRTLPMAYMDLGTLQHELIGADHKLIMVFMIKFEQIWILNLVRMPGSNKGNIAVLAHFVLDEKLHIFGILGCILCVMGSTTIVLHAPKEKDIESVKEVWTLATEPGFIAYTCMVVFLVIFLIIQLAPRYGDTHMVVYIGICSLMGSLTVMSVKALGIAIKLTFTGKNQFIYAQTWLFAAVVVICCLMQLNYLNKALDIFNTAVVSPVYYVMFTTLTIFASMIMFKLSV
ncbi:putative magnesium transporter NIPA1 [Cocos nucifera]|uniref:Probable magnesium transporter n=1 Tax=Cocos nucifera TaxID=13894 RepID=A0A8K0I043_COCNU|nr:putative magnesium transporter NIPA1 [Cocos nucifera]